MPKDRLKVQTADQIDSAKREKHTYRRKSYTTSGERRKRRYNFIV